MYEIEEFYAVDGQDLKELLKSCIFNYYLKNKNLINSDNNKTQKKGMNRKINMTNKLVLSMEGINNV